MHKLLVPLLAVLLALRLLLVPLRVVRNTLNGRSILMCNRMT